MEAASTKQQSDELSISESETRGCCLSGSAQGFGRLQVPWQAGLGPCQNLESWHNSMDLPVRPGLWPSCCSNQRSGLLWLLLLLLPTLEPQGQNGRRSLHSPIPRGRDMAQIMVSWSTVNTAVPLVARKPKGWKLWWQDPSMQCAVGKTL